MRPRDATQLPLPGFDDSHWITAMHADDIEQNLLAVNRGCDLLFCLAQITEIADRHFAPSRAALALGCGAWTEGRALREAVDEARVMLVRAMQEEAR